MTDDIHSLAARLDALEQIIADANADKAVVYQDAKKVLREDLPAFRDAMVQRRRREKNPAAYDALKGRAAELLDQLDNGVVVEHARAPARTRRPAATKSDRAGNDDGVPEGPAVLRGMAGPNPIASKSVVRRLAHTAAPSPAGTESPAGSPLPATLAPPQLASVPAGDPDEHWEKRDGHDSYVLALQVANGKVPHPGGPIVVTDEEVAACNKLLSDLADLEIPPRLRIGSAENDAIRRGPRQAAGAQS